MGLIQNKVKVSHPNSHVVVKNAGGLRGLTGETGQQGPQGVPGEAATVTVGTTTTLPAGSDATVQNVGSTSAAIFNFGIPKGDKGDTGESGAAATISVGTTTTLEPGEDATVTNSGTSSDAVFDFGIPKGAKGDTGSQGPAGQDGADGFSPMATVTKTGDTATITITDKDGTTTASISDGTTPTVNDGTLTIQKNGTTVQTFSADQASNVTANITVPTQFSDLSGTVSSSQIEDEAITTSSVTGTGTNITLAGTMEGGAIESVELNGDTEQTTYSGKNLFDVTRQSTWTGSNTTYSVSDGVLTVSGDWFVGIIANVVQGTQYYVSATRSDKSGASQAGNIAVYSGNTQLAFLGQNNGTFTAPGSNVTILFYSGAGSTGSCKFSEIQVEAGNAKTSFEPYVGGTASPNPDYPQEVKVVTGEQTVTISDGQGNEQTYPVNLGKNLLNPNTFVKGRIDSGVVGYASDTSVLSNTTNTITFTTTANYRGAASDFIAVDAETQYRLQQQLQSGTTNYIDFYDTSKTWISRAASNPFTTPQDCGYVRVSYQGNTAGTYTVTNLQLEKGSTATTYAPYFTPIELCKIGTYQDYIYKTGDDWYLHNALKKYTVSFYNKSGSTANNQFSTPTLADILAPGSAGTTSSIMSNRFISKSPTYIYANDTTGIGINTNQTITIGFGLSSGIDTVEKANTYASSNEIVAYYPLATPTDTQITDATLISELEDLLSATTYAGNTYITVSGDLASPLEVVAEADSKLAPDSVYGAAIKDGAVSVDKIADLKALADALAPYLNS